ncbi:catalase/peroxidase HPI [Salinisphaera sp.]|uniref:catalase/peroxidase HPI n=1 Tax=Salinisphaera sp. TaxID=1914330 RepID=UPI000C422B60|nr:catalase/peroxidase HPI [Salinisphaera sp.]MAS08655.1 catalase/peroxidase HPI [Salinisphaera sp.]|tara:strand:+ start:2113 stop:4452 length:2340 start_codon:yes stop_codon:yes gene_type:complete
MDDKQSSDAAFEEVKIGGKCPFGGDTVGGGAGSKPQNDDWWPNRLEVELLHQNPREANPEDAEFNYAEAFKKLDLQALKKDIKELLTTSVDWWPSDYGNYGPQMIRMAWHSAGTYRIGDGRGGAGEAMQRFAPINSWWDNGNIDKSRRLLWPIKQKYGSSISWADLIVLTGNCSLEIMGFPTAGFAGGRIDAWEPDSLTYWGPEAWYGKKIEDAPRGPFEGHPDQMVNRDHRWSGTNGEDDYDLEAPLAASNSNLIYVDPEGSAKKGIPEDSARDIRITFGRMAMNDEETVALIAGGHAFGKSHGMTPPDEIGYAPEGAPMEAQGLGWHNPRGKGNAEDTMTNGIEGSWITNPTKWDNEYLENLFKYEWEQTRSPAGALQWQPVDKDAPRTPDAHLEGVDHPLMMMTSDIALKVDPSYRKICERFLEDFDYFTEAFAKAWFKLTHRDMGPKARYLGEEVPQRDFMWQDPIPAVDFDLVDASDVKNLKAKILDSGLSVSELAGVAWGAASTFRTSDKRGGADGGRIRLAPQKDWPVNNPGEVDKVVKTLEGIKSDFDGAQSGNKKISLADLIVLAGCAAVEKSAKDAGVEVHVPFTPGRNDATAEQTDEQAFRWLEPVSDGFRNFHRSDVKYNIAPERIFMDRAALLGLTAPEWAAAVGGLRALNVNSDGPYKDHGVFTDKPGVLTNDFFVNLTSPEFEWKKVDEDGLEFTLNDRKSGDTKFKATRCDLIFGANSQLRQLSEFYAQKGGHEKLVRDFVAVWNKVMMHDRFDVADKNSAAL